MKINGREVSANAPTYFIADVAANHDGSLERALELMTSAKAAGADAAKFQHFRADHIVSDKGFRELGGQQSHQATWSKSVYEVYKDASLPWEWTKPLADHAASIGIDFFTSPYDIEAIDFVDDFVPAYKIGSGDITWLAAIDHMASKGKPMILATGAATIDEVRRAVATIKAHGVPYSVMQCNTNYTGVAENLHHIHLNVLNTYRAEFPDAILGLSDHTHGNVTVLGAVAMGARVIEKHFTDDVHREGPDHHFSMTPDTWREMVDRTRDLEAALGSAEKVVAENEKETVVIQRRGLRFARPLSAGSVIAADDLVALRPATPGCITPDDVDQVVGSRLLADVEFHDVVTPTLVAKA
ncbi:MAG: N-acetylneuraminate synthase family protein [Pontimonas sp.]|nr:N-acetylneuraminate synthase family protein [Pontimonas sp.]